MITTRPLSILLVIFLCCSSCMTYMGLRQRQAIPQADTSSVARVYFDRYGDLYPDLAVPIDTNRFKIHGKWGNKKVASLRVYFLARSKRIKQLRDFYGISPDSTNEAAYREAQRRIKERTVRQISQMVTTQNAGRLVYLVHGLNDTRVPEEYAEMRQIINDRHEPANKKPVFVEVHWDSMNAHDTDGVKVANIWKPALLNSRFVSIRFRNLMTGIEEKVNVPDILITHSLGAGVAFGALFNTTTKWGAFNVFTPEADKIWLNQLMLSPTPIGRIRIGVLAPAVPAEQTFLDFNQREPATIHAADNHIEKVVIGFNYKDYAVSKQLLHVDLAIVYGSTSLGCNCLINGAPVMPAVYADLQNEGYSNPAQVIDTIQFQTKLRPHPPIAEKDTREHAWKFYMAEPHLTQMLDILFQ